MAKPELIKKALEQATPAQLIRVRALIGENLGAYGYTSATNSIRAALDAFDRGEYDYSGIARILSDKALAKALE